MIIFTLCIIILYTSQGTGTSTHTGYAMFGFLDFIGLVAIVKPEWGEILLDALERLGKNNSESSVNQRQTNPKNSPQVNGGNNKFYYGSPAPDEDTE